jgi:hypothetical protein
VNSAAGWTTAADLRARVLREWSRGRLLAVRVAAAGDLFPWRIPLQAPGANELSERFAEARAWIRALAEASTAGRGGYRLEYREIEHRRLGRNEVPVAAWIDSAADALALIGKRREAQRFDEIVAATRSACPALLPWLARRPLTALEHGEDWPRLLAVVGWLQAHPRPDVYLRQIDVAGVHSKFIESYRGVLIELLDAVLPAESIDPAAVGVSQFARRYGFLDKPERIRFRILDAEHALLPGNLLQDITLDAESFARLDASVSRVFITENEINFLAFPQVEDSLVIFGAGYGFEMFRKAEWLSRCCMHYWGDIDTHGFAILNQLRSQLDHVESFLMDRNTLLAFETLWGEEEKQTVRDLPRLTPEESALYDDLRDNRIRKNLRLEQEAIGYGWVESALLALVPVQPKNRS